jgi:hypothetical protein
MPRFYFHLSWSETRIADDIGKKCHSLHDAHEHGRKLLTRYCYTLAMMVLRSGKLLCRMMRMILN